VAVLRLRLATISALVVLLAACGGSVPSSGATSAPGSSAQATETPGRTARPSAEPGATATPVQSEEPVPTDEPTPTGEPSASGSPSADPGGADVCSGTADNRRFFQGFANAVDWPVLCGVLPKGWFVSQGSYRLANGGKLLIGYKGPAGASIALSQGAWCSAADGCVPAGGELGTAALGSLDGTLYETTDGFAIISAPGENPSWLMTTKGLDRATTESLGAALAEVGG
jgi:hypothetical protein